MDMFKKDLVVAVKVDGKIMRETGEERNEILLPFGCEYSLMFKNLRTQRVAIAIEIDGQDVIENGRLLINGGETVELERFVSDLDKGNKFRFIQKTAEIQKHRGDRIDDGIVRVVFQYEKSIEPNFTLSRGISAQSLGVSKSTPDLDEGITVKGSESTQRFRVATVNEMEHTKHTMTFKLRGFTEENKPVEQPITVDTKLTCPTCGRKSKSGSKFCSNCGTHL